MVILIYIIIFAVAIALSTAILAGSLFLVEDVKESSFKELGIGATLARCAAICVVTTMLSLIPVGFLIALVIWFLGIMFLFQKTFVQTLILFLINALFGCGVNGAIAYLLKRWLEPESDFEVIGMAFPSLQAG
jgi:hypothetical protein